MSDASHSDENDQACEHVNTWFDRSLCFCEPGGIMHTCCDDCGATLDGACATSNPTTSPEEG